MQTISTDLTALGDARHDREGLDRGGWISRSPLAATLASRPLSVAAAVLGWLIPLAFLGWAARLVFVEGYLYEVPGDFAGDFTRTATLQAPQFWTGQGLFYGPIFVLESKLLILPGLLSGGDFARLDFGLFGIAFACVWLALIGRHRPRLAIFVLAAWLANHMSVEAFSNTAHLEVLELALMAVALLLATRGLAAGSGAALGLAIATKTLPALFLPYLAITRRWRMLVGALIFAAVPFFGVCWLQGVSPVTGASQLVFESGNLSKLSFSEYEYSPRAEIARMLAGSSDTLTPQQATIAIVGHLVLSIVALVLVAWLLSRVRDIEGKYGLMFGLVGALILIVSPSVHTAYYIFLLPAWTAILAVLLSTRWSARTLGAWVALTAAYTCVGFDQPFFLMQRLTGFGIVVPQHWLAWHLPSLGLLLTVMLLAILLSRSGARAAGGPGSGGPVHTTTPVPPSTCLRTAGR